MNTLKIRNIALGDGTPKICIPITAADKRELKAQVRRILECPCDMVEWRADFFQETEGKRWVTGTLELLREELQELPILFTFRTKEEGGERSIPLEAYEALNLEASRSGLADLADIEWNRGEELLRSLVEKLHGCGTAVIASFHDFTGTPQKEEIVETLRRMQRCGADVTKAAVMPRTEADVMILLEASLEMKKQYGDRPYITMSMGRLGGISRLAGALTGSAVTFATAGRASAPGQMEAELLARLLAALRVDSCR